MTNQTAVILDTVLWQWPVCLWRSQKENRGWQTETVLANLCKSCKQAEAVLTSDVTPHSATLLRVSILCSRSGLVNPFKEIITSGVWASSYLNYVMIKCKPNWSSQYTISLRFSTRLYTRLAVPWRFLYCASSWSYCLIRQLTSFRAEIRSRRYYY